MAKASDILNKIGTAGPVGSGPAPVAKAQDTPPEGHHHKHDDGAKPAAKAAKAKGGGGGSSARPKV